MSPIDPRFAIKLKEQIGFLQRSATAFDQGMEDEALRIATSLRVLFHDTPKSTSLMRHLGLTGMNMQSSSRGYGDYQDYLSYRFDLSRSNPVWAVPNLGMRFKKLSLTNWWNQESVFVHKGEKFSRRIIALSAANKDGGAHVDAKLEEYYEVLSAGEYGLGCTGNLTYEGAPPFEQGITQFAKNAHFALLRQFAHETLVSVRYFPLARET